MKTLTLCLLAAGLAFTLAGKPVYGVVFIMAAMASSRLYNASDK